MQQLLKVEWLKIKHYNAFKILGIFFIVGIFLSNYITLRIVGSVKDTQAGIMVGSYSPYNFDYVWHTTSWVTGCLLILPAMLMIILVTNEFTYKTNRQNIIDGWSRRQFIDVKITLAAVFALVTLLIAVITALIFGFASGSDFSFNKIEFLFYLLLKAFTYNMAAILFSVLIRRTGFAIGVFFIYLGAENLIGQLLDLWSVKLREVDKIDLGSMGSYFPMNAADGLMLFPENPVKSMTSKAFATEYHWLTLALALAYVALFIWWSRRKIIKSDL
ncbi:MAG: ABC transporter permease [Rhizobacter sp.]|nr:ABC transporter permease [Ferruginibacter sp.]